MLIRKVSIGPDIKTSMNYVVGQAVLDKSYVIDTIKYDSVRNLDVYIKKGEEVVKWKTFGRNLPIVVEYSIDF